MKKFLLPALFLVALPLHAQTVDTSGSAALIDQAMNHSEVMSNLQYLCDAIGPRLAGSPAMRKANDWAARRFRDYGLQASSEEYPFGVTWERGPIDVRITAPFTRQVTAWSWAWTAGTGGKRLEGRIVRIDATNADSLARYLPMVRGAWVMQRKPASIWNPDGPPMTAADSATQRQARERRRLDSLNLDSSETAIAARKQFTTDLPYGVPAWNFDQAPRGYNHTHHSQSDTFDHAVDGDLKQASAVMAVTAYELANLPVLLPRGKKTKVEPVKVGEPSVKVSSTR